MTEGETIKNSLLQKLQLQKASFVSEGHVDAKTRIDRIERSINLLKKNEKDLIQAMADDFGHRAHQQSKLADIDGSIGPLENAKKNLKKWMKPQRRKVTFPLGLFGARGRIEYQPLGVVGCISPWNFPVNLVFSPLAGIFSAGNRAMIKPSEYTPATSQLIKDLLEEAYSPEEVVVVLGGAEVGKAFAEMPFDHLLYTGSGSVAKHIMKSAAENLVPLTLELGGKSPVIIGESADLEVATNNIMAGKTLNAGQICLAPDYVFLPEGRKEEFLKHANNSISEMFPNLKDNPDYTSVINQSHFERLNELVADAEQKGAEVIKLNPADEDFSQQENFRIAPTLIFNPDEEMKIMQEEIFGPLLPVKEYKEVEETITYVNSKDRPLGLYYFGTDDEEQRKVLDKTTSGGVTINDVIMHVAQEDLPFGGVGPSGMGSYHGQDGFKTFSHTKSIYTQSGMVSKLAKAMRPPYKKEA